jgi:hypothetical protein
MQALQRHVVQFRSPEIACLKALEDIRNYIAAMLRAPDPGRMQLKRVFASNNFIRLALIREILKTVEFSEMFKRDRRISDAKDACKSVEDVLDDLGLAKALREALQMQLDTSVAVGREAVAVVKPAVAPLEVHQEPGAILFGVQATVAEATETRKSAADMWRKARKSVTAIRAAQSLLDDIRAQQQASVSAAPRRSAGDLWRKVRTRVTAMRAAQGLLDDIRAHQQAMTTGSLRTIALELGMDTREVDDAANIANMDESKAALIKLVVAHEMTAILSDPGCVTIEQPATPELQDTNRPTSRQQPARRYSRGKGLLSLLVRAVALGWNVRAT